MSNDKFYTNLHKFFGKDNIKFLNHGYYPSYSYIKPEHIEFKNQLSLYLFLFDEIQTSGHSILEIGCGRGGGIDALAEYFNFKDISACDLNKEAIKFCKKTHKNKIKFKKCSAEKLKYPNNSFDIIINVESSHCYQNPELFFNEVRRVLKPNGIFLYTDTGATILNFQNQNDKFKIIRGKNITKNIADSCKDDIENFKKIKIEEKSRQFLINLTKDKYKVYNSGENQYIYYACTNSEEWFKK
jgi:ubiquinone/menaquinone biosynthesis C-methylase UbiE